ncbi:MAG: Uma2 family endonuclease [Chloroflexi bacterium]|nr:Uma2 family endonuclease [Chloroflexota bacterium]
MTTAQKLTLEQFLAMPETEPASEFVCGEVVQKPMPDLPHSRLQSYLWSLLDRFLEQTGQGIVEIELRCVFGPPGERHGYVPDLVYISNDRVPDDDTRELRPFEGAPDIAIEVLSPDQHAGEFADKLQFYLMYGVRLVWVLDPDRETVRIYAPGRRSVLLLGDDVLDGDVVLPGFSVRLTQLFSRLRSARRSPAS